jgi:23S rRNA pseudouridine2605 synthase
MAKERLQKLIAQAGVMSRRKAEEAIAEGRVTLNGVVVKEMGITADLADDRVEVDGLPIATKPKYLKKTFMFYKPREVMTTKSDDRGRKTVMDFFEDASLNPVGRLDYDSEGLLLMTHDGDLLLKLTHPRYEIEKVYEVEVMESGVPTPPDFIKRMLSGLDLEDGQGKFDILEEIPSTSKNPAVKAYKVVISEGRNRFIRRMFDAVGLEVSRLKRVRMGEYELGDLKPGEKREV